MFANDYGRKRTFSKLGHAGAPGYVPVSPLTCWWHEAFSAFLSCHQSLCKMNSLYMGWEYIPDGGKLVKHVTHRACSAKYLKVIHEYPHGLQRAVFMALGIACRKVVMHLNIWYQLYLCNPQTFVPTIGYRKGGSCIYNHLVAPTCPDNLFQSFDLIADLGSKP